jgi:hypothetical protein
MRPIINLEAISGYLDKDDDIIRSNFVLPKS